jgi:hypothetical protein
MRRKTMEAARRLALFTGPPSALLRPLWRVDCMRMARVSAYHYVPEAPCAYLPAL